MSEPLSDEELKRFRYLLKRRRPVDSECAIRLLDEIDRLKAENKRLALEYAQSVQDESRIEREVDRLRALCVELATAEQESVNCKHTRPYDYMEAEKARVRVHDAYYAICAEGEKT